MKVSQNGALTMGTIKTLKTNSSVTVNAITAGNDKLAKALHISHLASGSEPGNKCV